MRVFRGFDDDLPRFVHGVATIGSFDGVHRGHYELLSRVREIASERGGESIVFTFEPHPRITLGRAEGLRLLNTADEKLLLLEQAGADNVVFIPFTLEFSRLSAEEFISEFVAGKAGVECIVMGYNHRFGRDRQGDSAFLTSMGLEVAEVGQLLAEGDKVSSTVIRKIIAEGDMAAAWRLSGHPYMVSGRVNGRGELEVAEREYKLLPPEGEYNARTTEDREFVLRIEADGRVVTPLPPTAETVFIEILGKH